MGTESGHREWAQRVTVKWAVQVVKRLRNHFEGNINMFWKEVKRVRKGELARDEMVKDVNGQILRDGVDVKRRRAEYFEQALNVADVREANINEVGNWLMPVLGELNERAIPLEEVGEAVNEIKSGKATGLDGFPAEWLKKSCMAVLELATYMGFQNIIKILIKFTLKKNNATITYIISLCIY